MSRSKSAPSAFSATRLLPHLLSFTTVIGSPRTLPQLSACGRILFPYAARFPLRILRPRTAVFELGEIAAEFQKVVHPKRRPASRDAIKGIVRDYVRDV